MRLLGLESIRFRFYKELFFSRGCFADLANDILKSEYSARDLDISRLRMSEGRVSQQLCAEGPSAEVGPPPKRFIESTRISGKNQAFQFLKRILLIFTEVPQVFQSYFVLTICLSLHACIHSKYPQNQIHQNLVLSKSKIKLNSM